LINQFVSFLNKNIVIKCGTAEAVTKVIYDRLGLPAGIQMEGFCNIQEERSSPALSVGNTNESDAQPGPAFEPPQYVTIGLFTKATNGPGRTANCSQVSLAQGPRIQSGSQKALSGAWRTYRLIFANEAIDLLVQER
jgi:hypothetical protein